MTVGHRADRQVSLTIDGRAVLALEGSYVLQAARAAGIDIPALCDHPALEPVGSCRACMVEVAHPDGRGGTGLVTACVYPVVDGLRVWTNSPRVRDARRQVFALLAARCPESATIQNLARQYGCSTQQLRTDLDADNCILCGLCTRICETYATAAIATLQRGTTKTIGTFAGTPPEECVGCGACAWVCPTGTIASERTDDDYRIWDRVFPTTVVTVDRTRCFGCGCCEEACPFSVPRVVLDAADCFIAAIPQAYCRGCGACIGACPSGAIEQDDGVWMALVELPRADRRKEMT